MVAVERQDVGFKMPCDVIKHFVRLPIVVPVTKEHKNGERKASGDPFTFVQINAFQAWTSVMQHASAHLKWYCVMTVVLRKLKTGYASIRGTAENNSGIFIKVIKFFIYITCGLFQNLCEVSFCLTSVIIIIARRILHIGRPSVYTFVFWRRKGPDTDSIFFDIKKIFP